MFVEHCSTMFERCGISRTVVVEPITSTTITFNLFKKRTTRNMPGLIGNMLVYIDVYRFILICIDIYIYIYIYIYI